MIAIAAASEPQRGWGGPLALLAAVGLFVLFRAAYLRWGPSPTPPPKREPRAIRRGHGGEPASDLQEAPKGGVSGESGEPAQYTQFPARDTTSPGVDPTPDPAPEPTTWGQRIRLPDGSTLVRNMAHIARTGNSLPPAEPRDDFDDALDLVAEPEPDELDEWLVWAAEQDLGYRERVRRAVDRFGDSESTVKRRIRELKDEEET